MTIAGLALVIAGIVVMSGDGKTCHNTSAEYYYNCDDSDNEFLCNYYGCSEWYVIILYKLSHLFIISIYYNTV